MAFGSLTYEVRRARRWKSFFAGLGVDIYNAFCSTGAPRDGWPHDCATLVPMVFELAE